ncbi:rod shape-determining protein MreD [Treponema primitia ZAS-2]|uniref:Rod shape-determining protein MreD n=1 Tax=Treponema primitia (strain ATCC BAA-887 / DSM 12427 / ZAS-2) TaxID=545694 RepID=F5YHX9_TREPZ|nr:rod shape-determining protein MreD [Treponema primitia]AEF85141.1 rod shape-determining protein MreD [Treponema primitia ZAS-2]
MGKNVIWATIFALIAAILQSTLLSRLAVYHAVPDLALGILVFSAYNNGTMTGQLTGFFSGLLLDFLSAAPLGLNTFVRTIIGASAGLMKGSFFLDTLLLPMALCGASTLVKALSFWILHILFASAVPTYIALSPTLWVEFTLNTLLAPFLFALLKLFKSLLVEGRNL